MLNLGAGYVTHDPPLLCIACIDGGWADDCLLLAQSLPTAIAKWWKVDAFIGIVYVWDETHIEVIHG